MKYSEIVISHRETATGFNIVKNQSQLVVVEQVCRFKLVAESFGFIEDVFCPAMLFALEVTKAFGVLFEYLLD